MPQNFQTEDNKTRTYDDVDGAERAFISAITHQLKTPLIELKGFIENILEGLTGPINEKQKQYLEKMQKSAERSLDLVDDWLIITKLESNRIQPQFSALDLSKLVADTLATFKLRIAEKDVRLIEKYDNSVSVKADKTILSQCVHKIFERALKVVMPQYKITVEVAKKENSGILMISDEGPGMTPEELSTLFESPFDVLRSKKGAMRPEHDFRFFIAQKLLELQNGSLAVESLEYGTKVRITLPLINY